MWRYYPPLDMELTDRGPIPTVEVPAPGYHGATGGGSTGPAPHTGEPDQQQHRQTWSPVPLEVCSSCRPGWVSGFTSAWDHTKLFRRIQRQRASCFFKDNRLFCRKTLPGSSDLHRMYQAARRNHGHVAAWRRLQAQQAQQAQQGDRPPLVVVKMGSGYVLVENHGLWL